MAELNIEFSNEKQELDIEFDNTNIIGNKITKTSQLENDGADGTSPYITESGLEQALPKNIAMTDNNNNFSTSQTINGTLTLNGDFVQNGKEYESVAEKVYTKDDIIVLRNGAVGGLSSDQYAGLVAEKYDGENDGGLLYDASGTAYVGDISYTYIELTPLPATREEYDGYFLFIDENYLKIDNNTIGIEAGVTVCYKKVIVGINLQPLATRAKESELTDGQVFVWNATTKRLETSNDFIKNTDCAQTNKAGILATDKQYGIQTAPNAPYKASLVRATNAEIDAENNYYHPIVSVNLAYATMKALTNPINHTWTSEQQLSAKSTLGINDIKTIQPDENGNYIFDINPVDKNGNLDTVNQPALGLYFLPAGTRIKTSAFNTTTNRLVVTPTIAQVIPSVTDYDGTNSVSHSVFYYQSNTTTRPIWCAQIYNGSYNTFDYGAVVRTSGNQNIFGKKTFATGLAANYTILERDSSITVPNTQWVQAELSSKIGDIDTILQTLNNGTGV